MARMKKTVLLVGGRAMAVDDERVLLETMDYNVITVETDEKALALIEAEIEIDLVIMASDLGPGIDSRKTAKKIRSIKGDIPLIFLCDTERPSPEGYSSITKGSQELAFRSILSGEQSAICPGDKRGLFEALVEQIDDIVVVKDLNLRIVATNQALVRATGCASIADLIGRTDDQIFGIPEDKEPVRSYMADERYAQTLPRGEYLLKEEPIIYPDGNIHIFLTKKYPIYDDCGRIIGTSNISRDITERKEVDRRVQALLEEKDLILKESHHRIKNNMNTVMSLLSLHSWNLKDPGAVSALNDARNRLGAMALLYDRLYRSGEVEAMSIKAYLPSLVDEIVETFATVEKVSLTVDVDDLVLPANVLSSLGILVNELVTNSMKYGVPNGEGTLKVTAKGSEGFLRIEVSDDGPGFPQGLSLDDLESSPGFGMRLISMMVRQLRGSISLKNGPGAVSILDIPL